MARIRSIKPEFFSDEDVGKLPPAVRLLFIAMWTEADKAGRLKDKPKTLKARCLPFDKVDIEDAIQQLVDANFIIRYTVDGMGYIQIRTWDEHQRPHHTERASTIPESVNGFLTVKSPLENGEKKDSRFREHSFPFLSIPFPSSSLEGDLGFREAWESWVKHRVQIKKPLTEEQVHKQLKTFAEWGPQRSIAAIEHTVRQGWQGLREPEAGNGQRSSDVDQGALDLQEAFRKQAARKRAEAQANETQ